MPATEDYIWQDGKATWEAHGAKAVSISSLLQVNSFTSRAVVFVSLVNRIWLQQDNKAVGLNLSSSSAVWIIYCPHSCQPPCFFPLWSTIEIFQSTIAVFNSIIAMPLRRPWFHWKQKIINLASYSYRDLQKRDLVNCLGSGSIPNHSQTVLFCLENRILLSIFCPGHQEPMLGAVSAALLRGASGTALSDSICFPWIIVDTPLSTHPSKHLGVINCHARANGVICSSTASSGNDLPIQGESWYLMYEKTRHMLKIPC